MGIISATVTAAAPAQGHPGDGQQCRGAGSSAGVQAAVQQDCKQQVQAAVPGWRRSHCGQGCGPFPFVVGRGSRSDAEARVGNQQLGCLWCRGGGIPEERGPAPRCGRVRASAGVSPWLAGTLVLGCAGVPAECPGKGTGGVEGRNPLPACGRRAVGCRRREGEVAAGNGAGGADRLQRKTTCQAVLGHIVLAELVLLGLRASGSTQVGGGWVAWTPMPGSVQGEGMGRGSQSHGCRPAGAQPSCQRCCGRSCPTIYSPVQPAPPPRWSWGRDVCLPWGGRCRGWCWGKEWGEYPAAPHPAPAQPEGNGGGWRAAWVKAPQTEGEVVLRGGGLWGPGAPGTIIPAGVWPPPHHAMIRQHRGRFGQGTSARGAGRGVCDLSQALPHSTFPSSSLPPAAASCLLRQAPGMPAGCAGRMRQTRGYSPGRTSCGCSPGRQGAVPAARWPPAPLPAAAAA